MNRQRTEGFENSENTLYDSIMTHVIVHLSNSIECIIPTVNCSVNYRLWAVKICQCRFINCNKCTTMGEEVDNGGDYAWGCKEYTWSILGNLYMFLSRIRSSSIRFYVNLKLP